MKIVINICYGGFGLSHKGMMKYAELKGLKLYPYKDDYKNKKIIYFIDSEWIVWIIEIKNNYKLQTSIKLATKYKFADRNWPKLTIVENNLYVLTPDYNKGRYVIDISNENEYKFKPLGL